MRGNGQIEDGSGMVRCEEGSGGTVPNARRRASVGIATRLSQYEPGADSRYRYDCRGAGDVPRRAICLRFTRRNRDCLPFL